MSPRRRTHCFVLILLLLNNDLDFAAGLPVGPVLSEYYSSLGSPPQLVNSLLTDTSGPGNRVLPEVTQKFPTQQCNDFFSFSFHPPGLSIDTVATTNYGVIKPNSFNTYSTYSPFETIAQSLPYPSNVDSLTVVENYPPVTQTIKVEGCAPTANVAEIYQTPITAQIPSMPQLSSFIGVASPLPEILPSQNIIQEVYTPNVLPEIYPQTIETISSVPVVRINMASPWGQEPVRAAISQPAPAPSPSPSFDPSFSMPPAPIIVIQKSKSILKSILPILLLTLIDGECGNSCCGGGGGGGNCGCSQCSATPVPFPIMIPTNNPVITRGRTKGKSKASKKSKS